MTSTSGRCLAPPPRAAAGAGAPGTAGPTNAGAAAHEVEVDAVESPLSPEDIMRLVQQHEDVAAAAESEQLVAQFRDDPQVRGTARSLCRWAMGDGDGRW